MTVVPPILAHDQKFFDAMLEDVVFAARDEVEVGVLLISLRKALTLSESKFDIPCDCACAQSRWERHIRALMLVRDHVARCGEKHR